MIQIFKTIALSLLIILGFASCALEQKEERMGMQLVWEDQFNKEGLPDSSNWSYDLGDGCPNACGWGNNELQWYTQDHKNARVEGGRLIIQAHRDSINDKGFSSSRLVSKHKGDWKYGYFEIKAKLPKGLGTWPAIWMLSSDWQYGGWPESGEIDIMEHVGFDQDVVHGTVHTKAFNHIKGTQLGAQKLVEGASEGFNLYAIHWQEEKIDFYINDELYFSFPKKSDSFEEWPFDQDFHLILNLAVGGNWGGKEGVALDIWPQQMEIEYVKVFQ